jgi:molecular chaperone DnaK (HSP70)
MVFNLSRLILIFVLVFIVAAGVKGQSNARDASGKTSADKEDLPKNIKESLAKSRIEKEKKEFDELLGRGAEALKLSEELEKSFKQNSKLSAEDQKKLDRLEKLVKKIRNELGGDGGEENDVEDNPSTIKNALETLQSKR